MHIRYCDWHLTIRVPFRAHYWRDVNPLPWPNSPQLAEWADIPAISFMKSWTVTGIHRPILSGSNDGWKVGRDGAQ